MEMKTCTKCGETFPATTEYFHKHKTGKFGLRPNCKGCNNQYSRGWVANNRERNTERAKHWYQENKERHKENTKRWIENNPERNREINRVKRARRRALEVSATAEKFTSQDVLEKHGTDCHICSEPIDLDNWHMDHVIPLQPKEGEPGEHTLDNVKPSHPYCNLSKGNKIYETIQF